MLYYYFIYSYSYCYLLLLIYVVLFYLYSFKGCSQFHLLTLSRINALNHESYILSVIVDKRSN